MIYLMYVHYIQVTQRERERERERERIGQTRWRGREIRSKKESRYIERQRIKMQGVGT